MINITVPYGPGAAAGGAPAAVAASSPPGMPALPPGFELDGPASQAVPAAAAGTPALPDGFVLDQPNAPAAAAAPAPAEGTGYTPSVLGPVYDQIDTFANSAVNAIPIIGPTLTNIGNSFDAGLNNLLGFQPETPSDRAQIAQAQQDEFPVASGAGTVFGTVAPFVMAAGAIPGAAKVLGMEGPLASRIILGGASSGAIGGADALARGADPASAGTSAIVDALLGGAAAPIGDAVAGALGAAPKVVPVDELQAVKNALYKQVDQGGVRYSPQGFQQMARDVATQALGDNLNPALHPRATAMLREMVQREPSYAPTLTQLDQLRQQVVRDVGTGDNAEGHFGRIIVKGIDNFIDGADGAQVLAGSGPAAADAIAAARAANTTFRKTETVADAIQAAERRAASTGSGGNADNAIRQNIRRILDQGARGFTPEERAQMERVVRGGPVQNVMRLIGKLSPHGSGLMAALSIGEVAHDPHLAVIPAVGAIAKVLADRATGQNIRELQALVSQGGHGVTQMSRPVVQAILRNVAGPGQMTMLENRSAGAPGPVAQALIQAFAQ